MFQESLVESTPLLRTQNRWPMLLSFAMQATILALAITIPLLHPEVLPRQALNKLEFLPAPRVKPPTPPPPQIVHTVQTAPTSSAPVAPQTHEPLIHSTSAPASTSDLPPVANTILTIPNGHSTSSTMPFTLGSVTPTPHVVAQPAANVGPYRVSEGVLAGNLLAPIRPIYPPIARSTGAQGTVIIQATISKSGTVESAHIVSGPLLLQSAALEAVRSARYRPYLLDHEPTEVETTFSINFHLGSSN